MLIGTIESYQEKYRLALIKEEKEREEQNRIIECFKNCFTCQHSTSLDEKLFCELIGSESLHPNCLYYSCFIEEV
jgi:hypothetical protein